MTVQRQRTSKDMLQASTYTWSWGPVTGTCMWGSVFFITVTGVEAIGHDFIAEEEVICKTAWPGGYTPAQGHRKSSNRWQKWKSHAQSAVLSLRHRKCLFLFTFVDTLSRCTAGFATLMLGFRGLDADLGEISSSEVLGITDISPQKKFQMFQKDN